MASRSVLSDQLTCFDNENVNHRSLRNMALQNSREGDGGSSDGGKKDQLPRLTFVDSEGYPLCFYIDSSVKKHGARVKLTSDIEKHGGSVVGVDTHADIVIVDDTRVKHGIKQLAYDVHCNKLMRHIYVEPMPFIQRCIRQGTVIHRLKERQGMGGAVGHTRSSFTKEEDLSICQYLALRIPIKEAGGRLGDNVYKELEELAADQPTQYSWVQRHTWQSLRERYKKKAVEFDKLIDDFVKDEQPTMKQHYFRNRNYRGGHLKSHHVDFDNEPHERDEDENEGVFEPESRLESELPSVSPAKRQRTERWSRSSAFRIISQSQIEDKGKQRAQPHQESEDEDGAAGPSRTQHTPFPFPRRSRSPLTQPQTSQVTLVPTSTPHNPQRILGKTPEQVNTSLRAKLPASGNDELDGSPTVHINHQSQDSSRTSIQPLPPVREQPIEDPPALAAPRRLIKKKAAPLGPTPSLPSAMLDPPYRNTRSRSRSVEPSSTAAQISVKVKRKGKTKEPAPHQPLEPVKEENTGMLDVQDVGEIVLITQSGEAMEEERDVEELLVADTTDISDDEQVDGTLRRIYQLPRPQFPTSNIILDNHPEDILRRYDARSASSRRSSARPSFVVRNNIARFGAEGLVSSRTSRSIGDSNLQPSTPVRSRKRSTSSAESFPLSGTKASAMKRKIQEEEKNNPYTPPPGTRAAEHKNGNHK
ncbi:hypothetical protein BDZ94DRAFT_371453 [Collybia nuda]|uniref:DNA-binding protein RAP1 n=1 Tax=Collybia nuda TaxID=64659 RepID=A0A9P6CK76_9AGAR|nr:hypothetical protein BDZ94DRAFT_371453 [Collybia nuda]